jgi:Fe-S cluster assembly protein SufD
MSDKAETALKASFDAMRSAGAPGLRRAAWDAFAARGLPTRRVESWHYTDLRAALREIAPLRAEPAQSCALPQRRAACRLVVLDGVFRPDLSDLSQAPSGVAVQSLRDALSAGETEAMAALAPEADDAAVALNAALMQDGIVLRIAAGAQVEQPIELATLVSDGAAQSVYTRSLVLVGAGASASLLETVAPSAPSAAQENHALLFDLGPSARIEHVATVAPQAADAVRVFSLIATLGERSALNSFCLTEGGGFLRRQVFATLVGAGAQASFSGASLLRGRDHADTTLFLRHQGAGGKSREFFRHIVDEEATGVFQGKVSVLQSAQKTDGAMQSKALLLSGGAAMNNKPELEIFADDVVCGHGATCGRLDADQLFYLTARGLPRGEAEALLIEGFAGEALAQIANEATRDALTARVSAWLAAREASR